MARATTAYGDILAWGRYKWLVLAATVGMLGLTTATRVARSADIEGLVESETNTSDSCAAGHGSCAACMKQFSMMVSCGYDYKTQRCCRQEKLISRLRSGTKAIAKSQMNECHSALIAFEPAQCSSQNALPSIISMATGTLGHVNTSDVEACYAALIKHSHKAHKNGTDSGSDGILSNDGPANIDTLHLTLSDAELAPCVSAMLRNAVLTDLKPGLEEVSKQDCNLKHTDPSARAPICCIIRAMHSQRKIMDYPCQTKMPAMHGSKLIFPMKTKDMKGFRAIREFLPGVEEALKKSIEAGPLAAKKFQQGKSSSSFLTTVDGQFLLKSIRTDSQEEDRSLLKLLTGYKGRKPLTKYFLERVGLGTYMNHILGMYSVEFLNYAATFIVMEDAAMGLAASENCEVRTYDLKGASRAPVAEAMANASKKERQNVEFKVYENNSFGLTREDCDRLMEGVLADASFMEEHHQIDYSIYARFGTGKGCSAEACKKRRRINCFKTKSGDVLVVSLIDYLNKYNQIKRLESTDPRHFGKFDNYAKKITDFVSLTCGGSVAEENIRMMEAQDASGMTPKPYVPSRPIEF